MSIHAESKVMKLYQEFECLRIIPTSSARGRRVGTLGTTQDNQYRQCTDIDVTSQGEGNQRQGKRGLGWPPASSATEIPSDNYSISIESRHTDPRILLRNLSLTYCICSSILSSWRPDGKPGAEALARLAPSRTGTEKLKQYMSPDASCISSSRYLFALSTLLVFFFALGLSVK
jgi:hypothetical protein